MNEQYDSDSDEADQREASRLREEAKAERADEMRDREKDEPRERQTYYRDFWRDGE
jgi:hypothetical protein